MQTLLPNAHEILLANLTEEPVKITDLAKQHNLNNLMISFLVAPEVRDGVVIEDTKNDTLRLA